jgi:hypothetical protein
MPHPRTALSAFRAVPSSTRTSVTKRFFTPSAYNMTIKSYFDVTWQGPVVEVDKSGKVTSKGEVKGNLPRHAQPHVKMLTAPRPERAHQLRALRRRGAQDSRELPRPMHR